MPECPMKHVRPYSEDAYRDDLPAPPQRIKGLPLNHQGYPVPFFVGYVDGEPDFRTADARRFKDAIDYQSCWVCGTQMGAYKSFVIGPMCAINRINAEPPAHYECALYSVTACPYLNNKKRRRNMKGHTEQDMTDSVPGIGICTSLKVQCIYTTKSYKLEWHGGPMWRMGNPERVEFYHEGRPASRDEVMASINENISKLEALAKEDGPLAEAQLARMRGDFESSWLPGAAA